MKQITNKPDAYPAAARICRIVTATPYTRNSSTTSPISSASGFARGYGPGTARFLTATAFRPGHTSRLIATRANGQPAFGFYVRDPQASVSHAIGLLVLTLSGTFCAMTRFDNSVLTRFGLPRTLPD